MSPFGFGERYESVVPITYTETTHIGDETCRTEMKVGEVRTNDLLRLSEAMKRICSAVRV